MRKKYFWILIFLFLLVGCTKKPSVITDYEKDYSNLKYELYPVKKKSSIGVSGASREEEAYNIFLLNKENGRVWVYDEKFASFITVTFKEAMATPRDENIEKDIEKYKSSLTPE